MHNTPTLGMILKGYPRISETFISNEIKLLEEQGFAIHIFSMRKPRENFSHKSVKSINAKVTYLPEHISLGFPRLLWNTILCALLHTRTFWKTFRFFLSRFKETPKVHTWIKHFMQACVVANAVEPFNITHLHSHFVHTPTSVAMYAAKLTNIPFSFTAHAKDIYTQKPERVAQKMQHALFAVTCTKYNKLALETIARTFPSPKAPPLYALAPIKDGSPVRTPQPGYCPVHTIYHGIDLSLFSTQQGSLTADPPYSILTVARLVEKKGLDTILESLRLLLLRDIPFRYTLIGEGPLQEKLEGLIYQYGLTEFVEFTGTLTHEEVLNHYRKADLFLLGCTTAQDGDRDGIPNVLAEAMAMGVPVVATRVSGIPELVEHNKSGLLAPCDDAEALADATEQLLTNEALRQTIITEAERKVHRVFNNRQLIIQLGHIFEKNGVVREEIDPLSELEWSSS
ncbi:glycosyltransferase [Halodesulfovibrio marinisediminis]|uniref:Glycosyltransferase involved in cell wall bisynthesis n=1 Tax=Halodesulfovibrio marinisediminis DSM 17456 TaxID=1121457 RepID=A0A1N6HC22_9BACT|nr:glycosyltransferase [Halodesulfovibrio marinisediminis]SIO17368.1 Glycosyltransferase involved in cell wall bisynthesis [Halodesulfovibrio marinisediminis DSM 17456]